MLKLYYIDNNIIYINSAFSSSSSALYNNAQVICIYLFILSIYFT